jgi:5-methyltetrahydropteroyltriglutamate--homocysteine methyltransferase
VDEPYLEARPEKARRYGLRALNRALEGIAETTAVHICFGYAAIIGHAKAAKPGGYAFLGEMKGCTCAQVSIEAAQPRLDCRVLAELGDKKVMLGVLDLADPGIETPEVVAARIRAALAYARPESIIVAPDCGLKYLPRATADAKMRAMVAGARLVRAEFGAA